MSVGYLVGRLATQFPAIFLVSKRVFPVGMSSVSQNNAAVSATRLVRLHGYDLGNDCRRELMPQIFYGLDGPFDIYAGLATYGVTARGVG